MKKIIFLTLFITSLFGETRLEEAEKLKQNQETHEAAAEIFFQLSLEGSSYADIELGKLYIYSPKMKNCQRGVVYLLNGATAETPNYEGFLEISKMFENGACGEKNLDKAEKYKKLYETKVKK